MLKVVLSKWTVDLAAKQLNTNRLLHLVLYLLLRAYNFFVALNGLSAELRPYGFEVLPVYVRNAESVSYNSAFILVLYLEFAQVGYDHRGFFGQLQGFCEYIFHSILKLLLEYHAVLRPDELLVYFRDQIRYI